MKKSLFFPIMLILFSISFNAKSQDFIAVNNFGDTIYYNIISSVAPYAVELTYKGDSSLEYQNEYMDTLDIPISVVNNNITYIVKSIGSYTFQGCRRLKCITIGDSITSIASNAFYGCIRLSLVNFNAVNCGNTNFNPFFTDCPDLTTVNVGNNVKTIPDYAFWSSHLTTLNLGNSLTSIGYCAFQYCTSLTSLTIPGTVTALGNFAFADCVGLTSVTIENGLVILDNGAFQNCTGITSVNLPNSLLRVGGLNNCSSLTSLVIPNSVTSFGNYSFDNCTSLKSITIPAGVTLVGDGSFYNCYSLDSIICEAINPPTTPYFVFWGVSNTIPIYIPCESLSLYQSAEGWGRFINFQCLSSLIDINNKALSCSLYPNPTEKETTLEIEGLKSEADIIVYDLNGKAMKTYKLNAGQKQISIDVNGFGKGVYSINIFNRDFNITRKLIVK